MHHAFARLALILTTLLAANAAQAETCADTTFSTTAAASCIGSIVGNINGSDAETDFLETYFGGTWTFAGSSDSAGNGPFAIDPSGSKGGTLDFDSAISGRFVIGLKAAHNYSYYSFNSAAAITSLSFDTTAGIALNNQGRAQGLSHAVLYTGSPATAPITAVPEPESWALLALGLGVVALQARRKS
ncbi:MAG: PEP-CTERM sorting domain-containing protein [Methyloversatilis sp.]|jgi:hypothetical protein|nr:PEP-CTERM sorting domain-containing protein [Methyloversatilis sp.]MBP6194642.1 PEP-CTERM sorting domain-containing protein [Methyloversatilis sp.]MBP9117176.1 PEP-CTERM sorting domain-containing protein [Methyloversatilis sp.]